METIILILIAMHSLGSPEGFNEYYISNHQCEITYATAIYDHHQYAEVEGGVVIEDDVNPCECE